MNESIRTYLMRIRNTYCSYVSIRGLEKLINEGELRIETSCIRIIGGRYTYG